MNGFDPKPQPAFRQFTLVDRLVKVAIAKLYRKMVQKSSKIEKMSKSDKKCWNNCQNAKMARSSVRTSVETQLLISKNLGGAVNSLLNLSFCIMFFMLILFFDFRCESYRWHKSNEFKMVFPIFVDKCFIKKHWFWKNTDFQIPHGQWKWGSRMHGSSILPFRKGSQKTTKIKPKSSQNCSQIHTETPRGRSESAPEN